MNDMKHDTTVMTRVLYGMEAREAKIDVLRGTSRDRLVQGLSEAACREVTVRVKAALASVGVVEHPYSFRVEAPAGDPSSLDLQLAVLALREHGLTSWDGAAVGSLSLVGGVRPCRGTRILTRAAECPAFVAWNQRAESKRSDVLLKSLSEVIDGTEWRFNAGAYGAATFELRGDTLPDFDPRGARSILLRGAPGSGKVLAARAIAQRLELSREETELVAELLSAAGIFPEDARIPVPFRAPHHTVSEAGLCGGGLNPRPGEVSLAHAGVLLLDEVAEFRKSALERLLHALRDGLAWVSGTSFPARPRVVVGTANRCPCGYAGTNKPCRCTEAQKRGYEARVNLVPWERIVEL